MKSKKLRSWHTYLGLSSSVFFFIVGITGILLTFRGSFSAPSPTVPESLQHQAPIPLEQLIAQAKQEVDADVRFISFPSKPSSPIRLRFRDEIGTSLYFSPSGTLVGRRDNREFSFNRLMFELHTGSILGRTGELAIAFVGFILILSLATGFMIWPRIVRARKRKQRLQAALQGLPSTAV